MLEFYSLLQYKYRMQISVWVYMYVCVGGLGFPWTDCFDTVSYSLNRLNYDLCEPLMEIIVTGCESSDLHYVLSFA